MNVENGSFRDPSGSVYSKDGDIYRSIFRPGAADFEAARDSGVYEKLIEKGLLIPHREVEALDSAPKGTVYCLSHPRLPMVSYPWEWPFSMLKDAALLHLDVMEIIIPIGFWLRDASAFNVQYNGERLYLIDTLSVGRRIPESPWVAYGQLCSHFLAPLAAAAYCDIQLLSMWRSFIDGFPLELAVRMLPGLKKYQPGLFMHLMLHSRYQNSADRKEDIRRGKPERNVRKPKVNDRGLIGLIQSLKKTINNITWKRYSKIWEDYKQIRTYDSEDVSAKSDYVDKVVRDLQPSMVWDLGANTGEFSIIAASHGAFVVSIEGDPACTESIYKKIFQENGPRNILPLTMDLVNPSPALGWDSKERSSLMDRGPADLLLALALVHHLVFSGCIPLSKVAQWFSKITNSVLVEFVPPTDPMVKKLLANRNGEHHPYSLEVFISSFEKFFVFIDNKNLQNGRTLFLYKRKNLSPE
jgi:hypothetical protein